MQKRDCHVLVELVLRRNVTKMTANNALDVPTVYTALTVSLTEFWGCE